MNINLSLTSFVTFETIKEETHPFVNEEEPITSDFFNEEKKEVFDLNENRMNKTPE